MSVGTFISGIIGGKTADIVDSITNTVDTFVDTKGEKAERDLKIQEVVTKHMEAIASDATRNVELYLADTANAREMNAKIQGDKPSWLAKNVAYILDLTFTISFLFMLMLILKQEVPQANKELFYTGFGVLGALCSTVLNFHRGTSRGSEVKQAAISKMMEK